MKALTDEAPLDLERVDLIGRFRELLDRVGFDERSIPARLGLATMDDVRLHPTDRPRLLWRTRERDRLSVLMRLFLLGVPVDTAELRAALDPLDPADLASLGLIAIDGARSGRTLVIRPIDGLLMAYDSLRDDGSQRHDHVLGVTGTTRTLAKASVRPRSRRTLDLGTGSGYQALLAASHSRRVLGTDLNKRAVNVACFNALLNGLENVETAAGSLFEPAGELRFDLIIANPPFVISPENQFQFRDGGFTGDELSERVVREAGAHLEEGGYAQILCNWVRNESENWRSRLEQWFAGSGCDALILEGTTFAPDVYAEHWLGQTSLGTEERTAAAIHRWLAYYESLGIEAIDIGLITLRRRSASANWTRFEADRRRNFPNGEGILASFQAHDFLDGLAAPRTLLNVRLQCRPELRIVQHLEPGGQGWLVEKARCMLGQELEFEGGFSELIFHLLTLSRGQLPVSAVIEQAAARTRQEPGAALEPCLNLISQLIEQGFLVPADPR